MQIAENRAYAENIHEICHLRESHLEKKKQHYADATGN